MQRVAITGAGIVSPIGRGMTAFAERLMAGQNGTRRLTEVFGASFEDVPIRHGAVVGETAPATLAAEIEDTAHRSIRFAADALAQIAGSLEGLDISSAGLHCGVGIGQLCPELSDLRKYGARRVLGEIEAQLRSATRAPELRLTSAMRADSGTALLQDMLGLEATAATYCGACSAATQACIAACEEVSAGATYALGGGHDTLFSAAGIHLMYELGTLSEEPDIRPFDVNRDGTMLGEGAAYFLFEDLEHAKARGATILAEVVGWASSSDGYHLTSPDPSGDAAVRMITRALRQAGLAPDRIDYVNAHGTSTVLNDRVEADIIKRALAGHRAHVSSTKAQVGHWIAACGAVGLAACLAAFERQLLPPNPHLVDPDPECEIELAPRTARAASIEHILCNAFGFGGQNSCVVLRRADRGQEAA